MRHLNRSIAIVLFFLGLTTLAAGEKFDSFNRDVIPSSVSEIPSASTFELPKIPSPVTSGTTTESYAAGEQSLPPVAQPVSPSTQPVDMEAPSTILQKIAPKPIVLPEIKPPKKVEITVPTFEMRGISMGQEEMLRQKKKKAFFRSIGDEFKKYWLLMVLGLVILLVVYALRKGTGAPTTLGDVPDKPIVQEKPKDIWEEF